VRWKGGEKGSTGIVDDRAACRGPIGSLNKWD
jgi:hypothetical protein